MAVLGTVLYLVINLLNLQRLLLAVVHPSISRELGQAGVTVKPQSRLLLNPVNLLHLLRTLRQHQQLHHRQRQPHVSQKHQRDSSRPPSAIAKEKARQHQEHDGESGRAVDVVQKVVMSRPPLAVAATSLLQLLAVAGLGRAGRSLLPLVDGDLQEVALKTVLAMVPGTVPVDGRARESPNPLLHLLNRQQATVSTGPVHSGAANSSTMVSSGAYIRIVGT